MKLAAGPYPEDVSAEDVVNQGTSFLVGTPSQCIKFVENYEAMGIEQVFSLCAIGPSSNEEIMNTIRLIGEQVIPHFREKDKENRHSGRAVTSAADN